MSSDLKSFLSSISGRRDELNHCVFDTSSSLNNLESEENFIAPLTHYGFLAINGPDTSKFLQGQTTCDLEEVDDSHGKLGACCSPKGRMITSFFVARTDREHYLLRMRYDLVETSDSALSKYIVFSKAKQKNACNDYLAIGLSGEKCAANVERVFGRLPDQKYATVVKEGNIVIRLDDDGTRFECWLKTDQLHHLWTSLAMSLSVESSKIWEKQTIRLGLGEVDRKTTEIFVPQMLNYQMTEAISFTKGCYTGQEVVARMHYKGTLKKQMYRIYVDHDLLSSGDDLYSKENKQSIGKIVNITSIVNNGSEALAVITKKHAMTNDVFVNVRNSIATKTENGSDSTEIKQVQILALPYTIQS